MSEWTPRKVGLLVENELTKWRSRAELAEEFALKTREEINALAEEKSKRDKIFYEERMKCVYGSFDFIQEKEAWEKFCKEHKKCRLQSKIDGGKLPYVIPYGTGVGTVYTAVCPVCGKEKNITYLEGW